MQTGSAQASHPATERRAAPAIAAAVELCAQRGVQLTPARRTLLEILWEHPHRPLGAYPLMRRVEAASGKHVTATSVYRALEFLLEQALVTRIESRNAYLPCPQPGRPFSGTVFLCDACGTATVASDPALERVLARHVRATGFRVLRRVIEFQGLCEHCAGKR